MMTAQTAMDWAANYGLGIVLSIGIAVSFWRLIIFVLKTNQDREARLIALSDKLTGVIEKNLVGLQASLDKTVTENEREHRKIVESLDRITARLQ
jgi:hypothetical protein